MNGNSITTRTGDGGRTRLASGRTVPKSDPWVEALGAVDEVVSALGLARATGLSGACEADVLKIQRILFRAGAALAVRAGFSGGCSDDFDEADLAWLDAVCRRLEAAGSMPSDFVVPGATMTGAALDLARVASRRCERRMAACLGTDQGEGLQAWMNRLSDALWLMARAEEGISTPLRVGP